MHTDTIASAYTSSDIGDTVELKVYHKKKLSLYSLTQRPTARTKASVIHTDTEANSTYKSISYTH